MGDDQRRKALIEAKNNADSLIYSTEKSLTEHKDKLGQEDTDAINGAISDLKSAMETEEDPDALKEKLDALQQAAMKIGEAVYKNSGSAAGDAGADANKDGETVDADYEEKKK